MINSFGKDNYEELYPVKEDNTWLFIHLPISRSTADISNLCSSAHDNLSVDPCWLPQAGVYTLDQQWIKAVALL